MRTKTASALAFSIAFGISAVGQELAGWIQPHPRLLAGYWEFVGRGPMPNDGIMVRTLATVADAARPGERIALVAFFIPVMMEAGSVRYSEIGGITEVRFVGSDSAGVSLETREGTPRKPFGMCMGDALVTYAHAVNPRAAAIRLCDKESAVNWGAWRALRFGFKANYSVRCDVVTGLPELKLTFEAASDRLRIAVAP